MTKDLAMSGSQSLQLTYRSTLKDLISFLLRKKVGKSFPLKHTSHQKMEKKENLISMKPLKAQQTISSHEESQNEEE
jgi:hypothetical protein